jgi:Rha family phage regulatory protein
MEELVTIKKDKVVVTSNEISIHFGKRHDHVLRDIESLKKDVPNFGEMFRETKSKDSYERYQKSYEINRDGFALLAMGFTGKKALQWKLDYINAFNKMESIIKNKNNSEWIEKRSNGKLTRIAETNTIQKLVKYAKEQGSGNADKLYVVYSKLANKMAKISERDEATTQQLSELSMMENIILHCIDIGMEKGESYKEIYQCSKKQLETFKAIAFLE